MYGFKNLIYIPTLPFKLLTVYFGVKENPMLNYLVPLDVIVKSVTPTTLLLANEYGLVNIGVRSNPLSN